MRTIYDRLLLFAACGINRRPIEKEWLSDLELRELYRLSAAHQLEALIGRTLQKAQVTLPGEWEEAVSKAIRKEILFDAERTQLLDFMEKNEIWYLPLKGIVIKKFYPAVGMRQMSDNDILFDAAYCDRVQAYMESRGYESASVGVGEHDVYKKEPLYNFEMHRLLYGKDHQEGWMEYYTDVKERLILSEGTSYGYHFSDNDFYVYMVSHAYKHHEGSGTGLRTLLDFYAYLKVMEQKLDFDYIHRECEVLGCAAFEKSSRALCRKVFSEGFPDNTETVMTNLEEKEKELLSFYLLGGVYGTAERRMKNRVRKFQEKSGSKSGLRYLWSRVFSERSIYWDCPWAIGRKWLLPIACIVRIFKVLFNKSRRGRMQRELEIVSELRETADVEKNMK